MADKFFDESEEQSRIKSRIVAKYFWAWARVLIPSARRHGKGLAYVDLFCGPGSYKDGTVSTPVMVLEKAIADPQIRTMLITIFNDRDKENVRLLNEAIAKLPRIKQLKHKPQVLNETIGQELAQKFERVKLVPTLLFIDPWGYRGLSLALISAILKDWGCDGILFFNYNRINPGLNNPMVLERMNDIFGVERVNRIRQKLDGLKPEEREALIIEEMSGALQTVGPYVLPFRFKNESGTRTSHYLIFVTKNFKGYEIMKEVMARESSSHEQGVASFGYAPVSQQFPLQFALSRPLEDLEDALVEAFVGRSLPMKRIYEMHSVGKPYVKSNYKKALTNLEATGKIVATPPADKRPKHSGQVTFADNVIAEFPKKAAS